MVAYKHNMYAENAIYFGKEMSILAVKIHKVGYGDEDYCTHS